MGYKRIWVFSLKIFLLVLTGYLIFGRIWVGEDAFISFRYIDNFVNGCGLVFNEGERVEGFTHPLWIFLLSFFRLFGFSLRPTAIFLGFFLSLISIAILLFIDNKKTSFLPIGVILLVTNSAFRDFATSGFETSLTYLLIILIAIIVKHNSFDRKYVLASILLSLLVLNRPETILILGYLFLLHIIKNVQYLKKKLITFKVFLRRIIYFITPMILILGGYQVFRMGYYASILPNTFYAKKGGTLYLTQGINYLTDFLTSYGFHWVIFFFIVLLIIEHWIIREKKFLTNRIHLMVMSFLMMGYVLYAGGDFMHGRFLLISFLLICIAFNDILERIFSILDLKLSYQIIISLAVFLFGILQTPLPVIAQKQINGVNDERAHFGFPSSGFHVGDPLNNLIKSNLRYFSSVLNYIITPITNEFGWSLRGLYYKELSEKLNTHLKVTDGNIGFFGYASGKNVSITGCNLIDIYTSRQSIYKRGTIGHEGEACWPYELYRKPHFAYTPYQQWNKGAQFKYNDAKYSFIITGDGDGSFKPIVNISDLKFIDSFSKLINTDITSEIDKHQVEYLQKLSYDEINKNRISNLEYFDFLERYWVPYTTRENQELFNKKRNELFPEAMLTEYDVFDTIVIPKVEVFLNRVSGSLTIRKFLENIKFAAVSAFSEMNEVYNIIEINPKNEFKHKSVQFQNLTYNKEYRFLNVIDGGKPGIVNVNLGTQRNAKSYFMKLTYRAAQAGNSISIGYIDSRGNYTEIFKHDVQVDGEYQHETSVLIDVTKPLKDYGRFSIKLNNIVGPAPFEVAILNVSVISEPRAI